MNESGQASFEPFPTGPNGELHHAVVFSPQAETTNISIKIPHLRNLHEKVGFDLTHTTSRAGFGFMHDGSVDTLARFMSEPVFIFDEGFDGPPEELIPAMVALMMSFSGSDLPVEIGFPIGLPGTLSKDTHATVGVQITVDDSNKHAPETVALIDAMVALVEAGPGFEPGPEVGLVAKGLQDGMQRGYSYVGDGVMQSDRQDETISTSDLRLASGTGAEVTFTVVPRGTEIRIGIDRDEDGFFDRDELDACSDPADSQSVPDLGCSPGDLDGDGVVGPVDLAILLGSWGACADCDNCPADLDGDCNVGPVDLAVLLGNWS